MVERRRWQCPKCGRRWDIPIGHDPKECPKCEQTAPGPAAVDSGERDFQSFFSRMAAETTTGTNRIHRPTSQTGREIEKPTSEQPFFVPLPTESPVPHAASMLSPVIGRRRKQRGRFPFAIASACVAFFLLLVGLIAYQKSTFHRAGANADQGDEANENSGLLARAVSAVLPSEDPDLVAVRAWLTENLNVPEWQELRWWPKRDMAKWYRDSSPDFDWSKAPPAKPIFLCRLKYRTKNEHGATVLLDHTFQIKDGKASKFNMDFGGSLFPD